MRNWIAVPVGALALGVYVELAVQIAHVNPSSVAMLCAFGALSALFVVSYWWRRWWAAACFTLVADGLVLARVPLPSFAIFVSVGFAALVSWWSAQKNSWPLSVTQVFLAVAVLVAVSLSLSGLLSLRTLPLRTTSPYVLAILYLGTPPWEWAIVLSVLRQSQHLRPFLHDNYHWTVRSWSHVIAGLAAGLGLVLMTALLVVVESHGLHLHVRANNPFVFAPALTRHHLLAPALVALGVVVLAPLAEEALFRGVLFGTLVRRWGYVPGSLAAATIFGLAHLDWSLFVPLAVAGLVLNVLYRQTGSLIPSTIAHATLNLVSVGSALGLLGVIRL